MCESCFKCPYCINDYCTVEDDYIEDIKYFACGMQIDEFVNVKELSKEELYRDIIENGGDVGVRNRDRYFDFQSKSKA